MKNTVPWDVMPYSLVEVNQHFGERFSSTLRIGAAGSSEMSVYLLLYRASLLVIQYYYFPNMS
jgi:hypothetical protein